MPNVLVYGGAGQLGRVVLKRFKTASWKTFSADLRSNEEADRSFLLTGTPAADAKAISDALAEGKTGIALAHYIYRLVVVKVLEI